ncbi:hypothetical protein TNCV_3818271 [Trichonephila clavipes]|nr:hypothetical protein TNCV_3818271 [Trichonephila clavipes]
MDSDDVQELLDSHNQELNTEKCMILSNMQVTVRFGSVSPQFGGTTHWCVRGHGPPFSLPRPSTSREDLRLHEYSECPVS